MEDAAAPRRRQHRPDAGQRSGEPQQATAAAPGGPTATRDVGPVGAARPAPGLWFGVAAAAAAATVTGLALLDVVPEWAGLAHHVAIPPLDLFADVRVLLAEAPSYPWFTAWLVAAVVARSLVLAALVGMLTRDGIRRSLGFYAAALVPALLAGGLGFSGVAALYSAFLWVGAAVTLVVTFVVAPLPWQPHGRYPGARLPVAGYVAALLVISGLTALGTHRVQLALVWVAAGLTALTTWWMSRRDNRYAVRAPGRPADRRAGRAEHRRGRPALPGSGSALMACVAISATTGVAAAGLLAAGLLAAGLVAAGDVAAPGAPGTPAAAGAPPGILRPAAAGTPTPPARRQGTLLLVPGVGGATGHSDLFRLDPAAIGFTCGQTVYFSYAGTGPGAPQGDAHCLVRQGAPYTAAHTRRPLDELVATFRAQLAALAPPVVVVTHSQGGWIAAAGIDGANADEVEAVVLLGAYPRHERGYVLDGAGAGVAGTDMLEGLVGALRGTGLTSFEPRAPLARETLGTPGGVARLMAHAFPGVVRVATVTSAYDLAVMGPDWELPGAANLCPVYVRHAALPVAPAVHHQVDGFLDGDEPGACGWWRRWPAQAFAAFGAPLP